MSVMRSAASGTLTETKLEALKAVYPSLYRQMSDAALERVASNPKGVSYPAKMMLSMLTGVDVDGTLSQSAITSNQAAIRATKVDRANAPPQSGAPKSEMTLAQRMATPDQRRELETE